MESLSDWLKALGLERYAPVFAENEVDFDSLRFLTDDDLQGMGLALGPRKKLLNAIAELPSKQSPTSGSALPPEHAPVEPSPRAEAERRQLTVLFCDLVGSTALAHRLDPEELRELMQAYRRVCSDVFARYEGHIAQYLGDGLLVYFGWPRAHEDDAERSVRAALEVVRAVRGLAAEQPLSVRIGIDTGAVVVGHAGTDDHGEARLAVGETPNVAARLQALASADQIVISAHTHRLIGTTFELADLGAHILKGIEEPVHAWAVLGLSRLESRFEATRSDIGLTPLVGREEEIGLLLRRWEQTKEGEGQLVLVGGEPGIGKSRLARVFRERLAGESCVSLRYQCSPYHVNSALYPIIEHLERAAGLAREDSSEEKLDKMQAMLAGSEAQRAQWAPLVAALLSLASARYSPLNLSAQKQKEKTLEALVGQIEALSQRKPVLMVFEDVHWIDATSQELLDLLVPRMQALPVLLIVTHRPEYQAPWVGQPNVTNLTLNRLGRRQRSELVSKLTGGKALPQEVLDQILTLTDGVPLFVEELTKSVLESSLLREEEKRFTLEAPLPHLSIPTTLRDSLRARLDRLAPIREVAQIGACIGREFSYELLAKLSPLKDEALSEALEQLTSAGLVFRRGTPPDARFTFKHALVQDAAYDSLLKSKRVELHAQIARLLEAHFPDRTQSEPELLAHHYTVAGLHESAIPFWRKAGELALQRFALTEAVAHLNKGLELIGSLPVSDDQRTKELEVRTLLGTTWIARRGWAAPEVGTALTPALELLKALDHKPSFLPVLWGLGIHALTHNRLTHSLRRANEMLAAADAFKDDDLRLTGHALALNSHWYRGEHLEAREHGERIGALYDNDRHRNIVSLTNYDPLTMRGSQLSPSVWMLGYPDQAALLSRTALDHARHSNHPFNLCTALTLGSAVFDLRCEPEQVLMHVEEAERVAQAQDLPFFSDGLAQVWKGVGWVRAGRLAEGIPHLRAAYARYRATGVTIRSTHYVAVLAEGMACSGEPDAGLDLLEEALSQMESGELEERAHLPEVLRLRAWILQQQGRLDEAERGLRAAIDVARAQHAKSWELRASLGLARLLRERGEHPAARALLAPIFAWFKEGFDTKDLKEARMLLEELERCRASGL